MAELELVRLHEDGERLVVRGPDGTESTLPITEALRAAVRRDRPRTEALRAQAATTMRPRDLQARLRAGSSAEELAEESGLPVEHVQRYEWPVVAERNHVVAQVRAHRLPGDDETTTLGEVADTRLAARGVTTDDAHWSARREGMAPWVVEVRFCAGDRNRSARWTYDPKGRVVTPLDDEARWLGQPDDPVSPDVLGVPSVHGRGRYPGPAVPPPSSRHEDDETTALLLDDLAGRRGQRPAERRRTTSGRGQDAGTPGTREVPVGRVGAPEVDVAGATPTADRSASGVDTRSESRSDTRSDSRSDSRTDDGSRGGDRVAEPAGASVVDLGSRRAGTRGAGPDRSTHPSGSARPSPATPEPAGSVHDGGPGDVVDEAPPSSGPPAQGASGPQPSAPAPRADKPSSARRGGRKGRAQVPSWDEIVFGGGRPSS